MVKIPTLREMANAGVHFGHRTSRWHPKMEPFIYCRKNSIHVINLEKTQEELEKALEFVAKLSSEGKTIIFVGSKQQATEVIKTAAENCGMPFVNYKWVGGLLTNFRNIKEAIEKHKKIKAEIENEKSSELNKKDLSRLKKEYLRGDKAFGGLVTLEKKPDALFLISAHDEKSAIKEAKIENIKIIAITDTNTDPRPIDYPIPANDDATKSIALFADIISDTIKTNKPKQKVSVASVEPSVNQFTA